MFIWSLTWRSGITFGPPHHEIFAFRKEELNAVLEPSNAGRNWLMNVFIGQVPRLVSMKKILLVGVVGGTKSEPELRELSKVVPNLRISTLGIEDADYFLDLNIGTNDLTRVQFDLILCSQVLEHLWNHKQAFESLYESLIPGGILWINAPTSNRAHGSPEYYSAGFTSEYLVKNLQFEGFEIIVSGRVGTKRNYLATHLLPYWLSVRAHRFPLIFIRHNTRLVKNLFFFSRYFFTLFRLQFTSTRLQSTGRYLTESWVIARRPN